MNRVPAVEYKHRAPVIRTVVFSTAKGVVPFSVVEEWICRQPKPGAVKGSLGEALDKEKWRVQRLMLDERGRFILYSQGMDPKDVDYSFPDIDQARDWIMAHKDTTRTVARLAKSDIQAITQSAETPNTGAEAA